MVDDEGFTIVNGVRKKLLPPKPRGNIKMSDGDKIKMAWFFFVVFGVFWLVLKAAAIIVK